MTKFQSRSRRFKKEESGFEGGVDGETWKLNRIWKNKSNWKKFEIYKIDFIYCRFSKTFNIVWKKSEKIIGHSWTSEKNENRWKKFKKITARFFGYCGVRHLGVPKGLRHWIFNFVPVLLTTVIQYFIWAKIFIYYHPKNLKGFWKSAINEINCINCK
jgi:hypothetical protein